MQHRLDYWLLLVILASCSKATPALDSGVLPSIDSGVPLPLVGQVTVGLQGGLTIPRNFAGLSIEFADLDSFFSMALPDGGLAPASPVIIQLLRNLGAGTLRVGGNSVDQWCYRSSTASSRCEHYFAQAQLQAVFATAQATGWPVILGVNLGVDDPGAALTEIDQGLLPVLANLDAGALLLALEIGNEADDFSYHTYNVSLPDGGLTSLRERDAGYGMPGVIADSTAYAAAFSADPGARGLPVTGPALARVVNFSALPAYAQAINQADPHQLRLLTIHRYPTSACANTLPTSKSWGTIPNLLDPETQQSWVETIGSGELAAQDAGLPLQLGEANGTACGGLSGVNNTLASALWGMDFLFSVAQLGITGVNFHGPGGPSSYAAIATTKTDAGLPQAQPLYYAMLAFDQTAAGKTLLPTTVSASINVTAYAIQDPQTAEVTVWAINKSLDGGGALSVHVPGATGAASYVYLTGPGLAAQGGIIWGGASANSDGTFPDAVYQTLAPDEDAGSYLLPLSLGTAAALRVELR